MEIIILSKRIWRILGIYCDDKRNFALKCLSVAMILLILVFLLLIIFFCGIYLYIDDYSQSEITVYVALECAIGFSGLIPFILIVAQRKEITKVILEIENLVNERVNVKTIKIYQNAEEKSEILIKFPIPFYLMFYECGYFVLIVCYWLADTFRGEYDTSRWYILHIGW